MLALFCWRGRRGAARLNLRLTRQPFFVRTLVPPVNPPPFDPQPHLPHPFCAYRGAAPRPTYPAKLQCVLFVPRAPCSLLLPS
jgi:hypothetical protein